MKNKTRDLYDAVIKKTIDIVDDLNTDRFISVDLVVSDYEKAIQGSMKDEVHADECIGCFFHFSQVQLLFRNFIELFCSMLLFD